MCYVGERRIIKLHNIDFTQLPNKLNYPPTLRGHMSTAHANAISQFLKTYTGSYSQRKYIVHVLNCISYMYVSGDSFPPTWDVTSPCSTFTDVADEDILHDVLGALYIESEKSLDWRSADEYIHTSEASDTVSIQPNLVPTITYSTPTSVSVSASTEVSDKSDLYIQSPLVPQFDVKTPWKFGYVDGQLYTIYTSLPIIPTKQNEISITTDVSKMSTGDLRKLFPNNFIQTRAAIMYESCDGITLDPMIGLILPIEGFTETEVADNIVRYPHLFRLMKQVGNELKSFYSSIEIDGELHKITDIWNDLPESKIIPYNKDFVKEYVVRRYLLERDLKHVDHRYKLYGSLDPFLTLFTTIDDYIHMGYSDPIELARCCVNARVNYKRSRNPVLRRLSNA